MSRPEMTATLPKGRDGWRRFGSGLLAVVMLALTMVWGGATTAFADADGSRVSGGKDATAAAGISPGDWFDEIGPAGTDESSKVYAVERGTAKGGVIVSVSMSPQAEIKETLQVMLSDGATRCASSSASSSELSFTPFITATVESSARDTTCQDIDRLIVTVTRTGDGADSRRIKLRVTRTPAVEDLKQFKEAENAEKVADITPGQGKSTKPGSWFSDAPTMASGETVNSSIKLGQVHTYRVPVRWGQLLALKAVFPQTPLSTKERIKDHAVAAHVQLFNPVGAGGSPSSPYNLVDGNQVVITTDPVLYRSTRLSNMQGFYTVVIALSSATETDVQVPYQLAVRVDGSPDKHGGPDIPLDGPTGSTGRGINAWSIIAMILGGICVAVGTTIVVTARKS